MTTSNRSPRSEPAGAAGEYLSFRLGAEEYGVDILKVQEIRGYEPPTRLAGAPSSIKGVVNLRGLIVPIVDLRLQLGLDQAHYDASTVVIILSVAGRVLGAVVDSVSDVVDLAPDQIRPAPEFHGAIDASYITGLGSLRAGDTERLLILTDIDALIGGANLGLVDHELAVH